MLTFAQRYGRNVYSQFSEDGIIEECIKRINPKSKVAVEFGGADGLYCSNTANLKRNHGWITHLYDINPGDSQVSKYMVTPENVNDLPKCSLISMDTDGPDFEIWLNYKGEPDIVVIEINSSLDPMVPFFTNDKGASYISMLTLGISKGYFLLCHTGNMIFVLNKYRSLFQDITGNGITNYKEYFNTSFL